jgi:hypothetical protein
VGIFCPTTHFLCYIAKRVTLKVISKHMPFLKSSLEETIFVEFFINIFLNFNSFLISI